MTGTDVTTAYEAFTEHRFYAYRGCAPDVDRPARMAGNPDLPLGAHQAPDIDGGEPQAARRAREAAALEVCLNCRVMVVCDAYASSVRSDGKLAEPDGVWGGRTALERHRALIKSRQAAPAAPDRRFHTPQKRAVLRAFAAVWEPYEVAERAGVDVRTANWQRSNLTTLLGLPRTASRKQMLAAARERGLLEGVRVVADDGSVPAVAPPTRMPPRTARAAADPFAQQPVVSDPVPSVPAPVARPEVPAVPGLYEPVRVPRPRRNRFADIAGQLGLWDPDRSDGLAPVHPLFPADRLETAA